MDHLIRTLPKLIEASGELEEVLETAALVAWKRVAGDGLRLHAVPFRLYRKNLIVAVADATWQKQMQALSKQLLFRVNSMLGRSVVTFIEFRIDPATVARARAAANPGKRDGAEQELRALQSVPRELRAAADEIQDEDLRRRFLVTAGACLERQAK